MKTLKQVEITPVFVEFVPDVLKPNHVYISEIYNSAIHNCLCGCGQKTVMPLLPGEWILTKHDNGKVSFTPSIGNFQFECKSHYIITKNIANFV